MYFRKKMGRTCRMKAELVVIGGGPAGMAAALAAEEKGIKDILIL